MFSRQWPWGRRLRKGKKGIEGINWTTGKQGEYRGALGDVGYWLRARMLGLEENQEDEKKILVCLSSILIKEK